MKKRICKRYKNNAPIMWSKYMQLTNVPVIGNFDKTYLLKVVDFTET